MMVSGAARVLTVGAAALDDHAGRAVARALQTEGMPVASRQILDEDGAGLEAALTAALATPGLNVILDAPGGSGEVRRHRFSGGRDAARAQATHATLDMLRRALGRRSRELRAKAGP